MTAYPHETCNNNASSRYYYMIALPRLTRLKATHKTTEQEYNTPYKNSVRDSCTKVTSNYNQQLEPQTLRGCNIYHRIQMYQHQVHRDRCLQSVCVSSLALKCEMLSNKCTTTETNTIEVSSSQWISQCRLPF